MKSHIEGNLAAPLEMNFIDANEFTKHNYCLECRGGLYVWGRQDSFVEDKYEIHCFKCRKAIREGEYISSFDLAKLKESEWIGRHEIKDVEKMSTEQALKDLGFE